PQIQAGQQLGSEAWIDEVVDSNSGRTVVVSGHVISDGTPSIKVTTTFLFRNAAPDYASNFRHVSEQAMLLNIRDKRTLALVKSKEWLVPVEDASAALIKLGAMLKFGLSSRYRFKAAGVYASVATFGEVHAQSRHGTWVKVAD
ncbi:fatty acid synthase alpha subunit Lsd1, partial [Coemansia aciculifera]